MKAPRSASMQPGLRPESGVDKPKRAEARSALDTGLHLPDDVAVQGNLDPITLFAPRDVLRGHVLDIMERVEGRDGHIFNLGHGILPETPIGNVEYVIELVHGFGSGGR